MVLLPYKIYPTISLSILLNSTSVRTFKWSIIWIINPQILWWRPFLLYMAYAYYAYTKFLTITCLSLSPCTSLNKDCIFYERSSKFHNTLLWWRINIPTTSYKVTNKLTAHNLKNYQAVGDFKCIDGNWRSCHSAIRKVVQLFSRNFMWHLRICRGFN